MNNKYHQNGRNQEQTSGLAKQDNHASLHWLSNPIKPDTQLEKQK